jgi:uncharacterized membrane protein YeiB
MNYSFLLWYATISLIVAVIMNRKNEGGVGWAIFFCLFFSPIMGLVFSSLSDELKKRTIYPRFILSLIFGIIQLLWGISTFNTSTEMENVITEYSFNNMRVMAYVLMGIGLIWISTGVYLYQFKIKRGILEIEYAPKEKKIKKASNKEIWVAVAVVAALVIVLFFLWNS